MREATAAIIVAEDTRLILQQRDSIPGILHPGKVGLFGGHREGDESFVDCIIRELHEEIGCYVPANRFVHLATRTGPDLDVEGGTVHGEIFVVRDVAVEQLVATEGTLLVIHPAEISTIASNLVPSAYSALKFFGLRL
ncbi:NUDIX domain-containing protein [Bradyrhizobium sp. 45]|uniref:NUDIX domain-containing protein n=1 Tax=Bradyrhizobium sp. 45 TaxID=1043587 RepID=UPI001FF72703|nr:NUDIX domain-containing protein [Bradyrhizobium sp. 45]MCK1305761.1 NUDIX domain-containing protein [Bradyrhizobium sp. 45]